MEKLKFYLKKLKSSNAISQNFYSILFQRIIMVRIIKKRIITKIKEFITSDNGRNINIFYIDFLAFFFKTAI